MKLDKLTVYNFRQFYGRQQLVFSKSKEQNATVVHGKNGAGKTSLFTAINWCLYGAGAENIGTLINKEAISQAPIGGTIQASVELSFSHNSERYVAVRKLFADKNANGTARVDPHMEFTLMRTDAAGQATRVDNPVGTLNSILAEKVRTYFFFDGEKIDNFSKPDVSNEIKDAIYNVLGLEVLTRGTRHLAEAATSLRREWKKSATGILSTLLDEEISKRTEIEKLKGSQVELDQQIGAARRHIESVEQRLRELESSRHLQERLDDIKVQMERLGADRDRLLGRIRDASTQGYVILARDAITKALGILDEKRARGEIPSNIREQFVVDLLHREICVCGRTFTKGDEVYKHLQAILATSVSGTLEDDVLGTGAVLRTLSKRAEELLENIGTDMSTKVAYDGQYDSLYAQEDDISRQIKSSDQNEIQKLGHQRDQYNSDMSRYQMDKGINAHKIEMLVKEIAELEKRIVQARKQEAATETMGRKVELAQRAAEALDAIYQAFAEDRRKRIEAEAQSIFQSLVWKESQFRGMSLDENYKLEVYDRWGQPARPELSAGERQVLSLSFIMAMAQVSDEEAPLVMDTPFGRLSSAHRDNITSNIPSLADQLVLFVTDEELRGQALDNLRPRIGAEYKLSFDHKSGCTTIEEVE